MADEKNDSRADSDTAVDSSGMIDAMMKQLVESGEADQMAGLDLDRLRAAMSAPGAADTVAAIQALGADSQAGVGHRAPDFELPYLPGQGKAEGERVRLSRQFAERPVALVFGSYT
jgi:hypothetical protein